MAPFDKLHTSFYWRSIVTMALSCIVLEIFRVIGRNFYTLLYLVPPQGWPVGISRRCLIFIKLEWLGYRAVKNLWRYVKPFWYNTETWQTDRFPISISRASVVVLTNDSKQQSNSFCFSTILSLFSGQFCNVVSFHLSIFIAFSK